MVIHIATDHAGFDEKNAIVSYLQGKNYEVVDHGAHVYDSDDDYPSMCIACGEAVAKDPNALGILIGGSGNGEQISANKVKGVRAALVWNVEFAKLARQHNNANIISLGARQHSIEECIEFVQTFIDTPFSGSERHVRRINLISNYEK